MGEQHILNEISNTRKMSKYHCLLKKKTKQNKTSNNVITRHPVIYKNLYTRLND